MTVCDAVAHVCLTPFAVVDPICFCIVPNMMSMLNQAAVEALCSATYLENYLDCTENLPDDLQRIVTHLRELDFQTNGLYCDTPHIFWISKLAHYVTSLLGCECVFVSATYFPIMLFKFVARKINK